MGPPQALHIFVLDSSASMLESGAFAKAKGLLLQWLRWAYLQRTPVALLCFGAGQLQWSLPPGRAPRWNADRIEPLRGGGGTPLQAALQAAWALAAQRPGQAACLWVISDFRSPDVLQLAPAQPPALAHVLVDCEAASTANQRLFGGAQRLAQAWPNAVHLPLPV